MAAPAFYPLMDGSPFVDAPGAKQDLPREGRFVTLKRGLNPENACKYATINALYSRITDDKEALQFVWDVFDAPTWTHKTIPQHVQIAIVRDWEIEKKLGKARRHDERDEQRRIAARDERVEERARERATFKRALDAAGLVEIKEKQLPKSSPESSPEVNDELLESAKQSKKQAVKKVKSKIPKLKSLLGPFEIVPRDKEERKQLAKRKRDAAPEEEEEEEEDEEEEEEEAPKKKKVKRAASPKKSGKRRARISPSPPESSEHSEEEEEPIGKEEAGRMLKANRLRLTKTTDASERKVINKTIKMLQDVLDAESETEDEK